MIQGHIQNKIILSMILVFLFASISIPAYAPNSSHDRKGDLTLTINWLNWDYIRQNQEQFHYMQLYIDGHEEEEFSITASDQTFEHINVETGKSFKLKICNEGDRNSCGNPEKFDTEEHQSLYIKLNAP